VAEGGQPGHEGERQHLHLRQKLKKRFIIEKYFLYETEIFSSQQRMQKPVG